jgi:hypothetical protein
MGWNWLGSAIKAKAPLRTGLNRKIEMNGTKHDPVCVKYTPREMEMYSFTKREILSFRETDGSWQMGVSGTMFGVFLSLLIAAITYPGNSPWLFASFLAIAIATGVLALVFGVQAFYFRSKSRKEIDRFFQTDVDNGVRQFNRRPGA